ncbi:Hypothetical protein LUCI_1020 [Lucifera butyrica]|uniref:Uncharacterized protein n=1 Tax=Lucifera butyrica TaxID=1351585 RepID=A0A498R3R8_9FIRM|nr:hypothetical protein [Lucifera butyrica]VBB05809.1 Hypothetical protein LUCI_1020 [Lucifera butyrica]
MLQKVYPWFLGGVSAGLVVSLCLWLMLMPLVRLYTYDRGTVAQSLTSSIIESSASNPELQDMMKNQVLEYLKSPEGKAKMAELLKSPEMTKAMSENIQSPEVRKAVLKLMQVPEFRNALMESIKNTPEGRILGALSSAIVLDDKQAKPVPSMPSGR